MLMASECLSYDVYLSHWQSNSESESVYVNVSKNVTQCFRMKSVEEVQIYHKLLNTNFTLPMLAWVSIFEISSVAELNLYFNMMLYYVSLTNIRQGVKQDTRVQLQVMYHYVKIKLYLKDNPRLLISLEEIQYDELRCDMTITNYGKSECHVSKKWGILWCEESEIKYDRWTWCDKSGGKVEWLSDDVMHTNNRTYIIISNIFHQP